MSRLVSVIVPAYDRERTIGATISGALTQTYPDVEVVVVDDGSRDGTVRVARAYGGERVTVVEQANAGPSAARNAALRAARGELVATCDSDDYLLPNHVEAAVALLDRSPARTAVAGNAYVVGREGIDRRRTLAHTRTPRPAEQRLAMLQSNWASYLMLAPRELFDETGGYDESMRSSEDWDLWVRALYSGWTIARQETPTALYEQVENSLSHDRSTMTATENRVVERALASFGDRMTPAERAYCDERLRLGSPMDLTRRADAAFRAGRRRDGVELLRTARRLAPREHVLAAKARLSYLPGADRALEWHARRGR